VAQLVDGSHGTGLNALSRTLFLALDRRDRAIQDILTLAPPAPSDDDAADDARASGDGPVVSTFDTVMPNVAPQLDDEIDAIEATKSESPDLTPTGRGVLEAAEAQIGKTKTVVDSHWPPIPDED
jgi:hypothetical protein